MITFWWHSTFTFDFESYFCILALANTLCVNNIHSPRSKRCDGETGMAVRNSCSHKTQVYYYYYIIIFLLWYFIPRVLKLANVEMYVRNDYDGDSETVNVLARQTALKGWIATEMHWYRNVVSRDRACRAWLFCRFLQWGCESRLTKDQESLPPPEKKHVTSGKGTVLGRLSRRRGHCTTSCL